MKNKIWVDADACPKVIKTILFRAAKKRKVEVTLVSNSHMHVPPSSLINTILVEAGADVADQKIVEEVSPGDLVITADIPLAAEVIAKEGLALSPRGEFFDEDDIGQRVAMRDFMDELRGTGKDMGGPPTLNEKDRQAFANELDRWITKREHK